MSISVYGNLIAYIAGQNVIVLNYETDVILKTLEHPIYVWSVVWSPDGSQVATGSSKTVRVWDAGTGECVRTLEGHSSYVLSVAWSPDGSKVASGSEKGKVRIWDTKTGESVGYLIGHKASANTVSWSLDGNYIATGGGRKVCVWDAGTGNVVQILE